MTEAATRAMGSQTGAWWGERRLIVIFMPAAQALACSCRYLEEKTEEDEDDDEAVMVVVPTAAAPATLPSSTGVSPAMADASAAIVFSCAASRAATARQAEAANHRVIMYGSRRGRRLHLPQQAPLPTVRQHTHAALLRASQQPGSPPRRRPSRPQQPAALVPPCKRVRQASHAQRVLAWPQPPAGTPGSSAQPSELTEASGGTLAARR